MKMTEHLWREAMPGKSIGQNEVHIWKASLDLNSSQTEKFLKILSVDELQRAGRFHFEKDRHRYIAARGILRKILGTYIETKPDEILFEYSSFGKPAIATDRDFSNINFNLSHSGALALYAFTHDRKIGIDIEQVRFDIDVMEIAGKFFSEEEITSLKLTDEQDRHDVFHKYWTRKEAFLKALGEGISFPMKNFDVSSINETGLLKVELPADERNNVLWYLQDLFPVRGYRAAVVTEEGQCELSCLNFLG